MMKRLLILLMICLSLTACQSPEIRPYAQCRISYVGKPIIKNGQQYWNLNCSCRGYKIGNGTAGPTDELKDAGFRKKSHQYKDSLCRGMIGIPVIKDHGYLDFVRDVKRLAEWLRDQRDNGRR